MARILLSGSTGLIGRHLAALLRATGDEVIPLVRGFPQLNAILWNPNLPLDPALVGGFDAVIHLAGESVAALPWTRAKKQRIFSSRVDGTRTLVTALAATPSPPRTFLCASGINIYGDHGAHAVHETTPPGNGFLAEVCQAWEAACDPIASSSRVVNLRIGAVLTPEGGALATALPLFRCGLGGTIGDGALFLSWISLPDLLRAIVHLLRASDLRGPVNVVTPTPATNKAFTIALAHAVHRPALFRAPQWLVRLIAGEFADETLLSSVRAYPDRLLADGFRFEQTDLAGALQTMLS